MAQLQHTVRDRIAKQIIRNVAACPEISWSNEGQRTPLEGMDVLSGDIFGVFDTTAGQTHEVGYVLDNVRFVIEFWHYVADPLNAATELNYMIGVIKRALLRDMNLKESGTGVQLAERITLQTDEADIDGPSDSYVAGYIVFSVLYRHAPTDPFVVR